MSILSTSPCFIKHFTASDIKKLNYFITNTKPYIETLLGRKSYFHTARIADLTLHIIH